MTYGNRGRPFVLIIAAIFVFTLGGAFANAQSSDGTPLEPGGAAATSSEAPSAADLVAELATANYRKKVEIVEALAASGEPFVERILIALSEGALFVETATGRVVIGAPGDDEGGTSVIDPITGAPIGTMLEDDLKKIRINNRVRVALRGALARISLFAEDEKKRLAAAEEAVKSADPAALDLINAAYDQEESPRVKKRLAESKAAIELKNTAAPAQTRLDAIDVLENRGDTLAKAILTNVAEDQDADVAAAATRAIEKIERNIAYWNIGQNAWYGLSLASVLLLAATGLAITFGVMGVINMAHGEMVMIGAYSTFVVQQFLGQFAPGLMEWSLIISVPVAFCVSGAVGMGIERGVIRFLYGRPLETLLATWGVSLALQQTVRSLFGATNKQVSVPTWLSGSFDVGLMTITYNRLAIVIFAVFVFAGLIVLLRKTIFGLQTRAVTQNRRMAASVGIRTEWIDMMTFGLGSGVAGIAGVALSQIDNVSPNLGQTYIVDCFMVVVFGGASNLWGTLVGALTIGVSSKFLEPAVGAVLGKILILVFIILFIQVRPRGLFALRGRAAE